MLCLNMTPGEYMTVGEEVVIQLDRISGDRCRLMVEAPREIPVWRGEIRERNGLERPACVTEGKRWHRQEIPWSRSKAQALNAMRKLLSEMEDGQDGRIQTLQRQLDHMFPPTGGGQSLDQVSNG